MSFAIDRAASQSAADSFADEPFVDSAAGAQATGSRLTAFKSSLMARTAAALCLFGLAGCESVPDYLNPEEWYKQVAETFEDDDETPSAADTPVEGDFPNLASVPPRPQATVEERQAALSEGLMAGSAAGAYSDQELQPGAAPQKITQTPPASSGFDRAFATVGAAPSSIVQAEVAPTPLPGPSVPALPPKPTVPAGASAPVSAPAQGAQAVTPSPSGSGPITLPPDASVDPYVQYYGGKAPQPLGAPAPVSVAPVSVAPGAALVAEIPPTPRTLHAFSAPPGSTAPSVVGVGAGAAAAPVMPRAPRPIMARNTPARAALQGGLPEFPSHRSLAMAPRARAPYDPHGGGAAAPFFAPGARLSVLIFEHGSARLSSEDRDYLRTVADIWRQQGGELMVVGHASHPADAKSVLGRQIANFRVSGMRTDAVRGQLRRYGVPAAAISTVALADNRPEYAETGPNGVAGNRRVEIYLVR